MTISKGEFLGGVTLKFQPWKNSGRRHRRHSHNEPSRRHHYQEFPVGPAGRGRFSGPRRHSDTLVMRHHYPHDRRGSEPSFMGSNNNNGGGVREQPPFAAPRSSSAGRGTKVLVWSIGSENWTRSWLLDNLETEMRKFVVFGSKEEEEGRRKNDHHHQASGIVDAYPDGGSSRRGSWVIELDNADIAMKLRKELVCTRNWWVCGFEGNHDVYSMEEVSNLPTHMDSSLHSGEYQQQQQQRNTYREDQDISFTIPPQDDEAAKGTTAESSKKQRLMVFQRPPSNIDGHHLLSFLNDHLKKNNVVVSCRSADDGKKQHACKISSVSKHHGDPLETCWVIIVDSEATRIVVSNLDDIIFQNSVLSFHEYVNLSFHTENQKMMCEGDNDINMNKAKNYYGEISSSQSSTCDDDNDTFSSITKRNHEEPMQPSDNKIKQECLSVKSTKPSPPSQDGLEQVLPMATTSCDSENSVKHETIGDDLNDHQHADEMAMKDEGNGSEVKILNVGSKKPSSPTTPLPKVSEESDITGIISPDHTPLKPNGRDNKILFQSDGGVATAFLVTASVAENGNATPGKDSTASSRPMDDDISLHEGGREASCRLKNFIVDGKTRADSSAIFQSYQQDPDANRIPSEDSATKSSSVTNNSNDVEPAEPTDNDKGVLVFSKQEWILLQKTLDKANEKYRTEQELVQRLSAQVKQLEEENTALAENERSALDAVMVNEEIVTSSEQEKDRIKTIAATTYQDLQNAKRIAMAAIQELHRTKNEVRTAAERFAKRELDAQTTLRAQQVTTASAVQELATTRGRLRVVHGDWKAKCDQLEDMKRQLALQTKLKRSRVAWKDELEDVDTSRVPKEHQ